MSRYLKVDLNPTRKIGDKYNFIKHMLDKSKYTGPTKGVHAVKAVYHWKNVLDEIHRLEGRASEFIVRADELKAGMNVTPTVIINLSKSEYKYIFK